MDKKKEITLADVRWEGRKYKQHFKILKIVNTLEYTVGSYLTLGEVERLIRIDYRVTITEVNL